jgi:hypothetical protein
MVGAAETELSKVSLVNFFARDNSTRHSCAQHSKQEEQQLAQDRQQTIALKETAETGD